MQATAPDRVAAIDAPVHPVYTTRDDLAQSFHPINAYERMLATTAAQAYQRLQRAYELEERLLQTTDALELFNTAPDRFKAVVRHIAECDRIWRRAIDALQRAKHTRTGGAAKRTTILEPPSAILEPNATPAALDRPRSDSHNSGPIGLNDPLEGEPHAPDFRRTDRKRSPIRFHRKGA